MEQAQLHDIERRCIQEEPPWCTAACPLHVDARGFIRRMAAGDWDAAWTVLHRTMPLPGVLGRICDAPCRTPCRRAQIGGAIDIAALERFCVAQPPPRRRHHPLPPKDARVAVIGAGLSGLTAAWDLARKGYRVVVHDACSHCGDRLLERHAPRLSPAVVAGELAELERLGVTFRPGRRIDPADVIREALDAGTAVYLSLDAADPAAPSSAWGIDTAADGRPDVPSPWQTTGRPGVFAGGADRSPVRQAAEGRWAATSIDRYVQQVSPTAGREADGSSVTRLFTRIDGVAPLPVVPPSGFDGNYTPAEARAEAGRCLQCECLECVKVCPYLEHFKGYPRKYAREIYNNESIVMGARQANRLINSCSLCGLCETVCPEGFPMPDLCLQARRSMVQRGKMPPSAHEFALLDMAFSQGPRFFLARHEPGRRTSAVAFFPGCQLAATRPDQTAQVYDHLRARLEGGVALFLGCCGAPAHWAGRVTEFARETSRLRAGWQELGRPQIVAACATCNRILREHLPDIPLASLWQVLDEAALPAVRFRPAAPVAVHDPCTARDRPADRAAVRRLLDAAGVPYDELALGQDRTECCGFGGLQQHANPDLAREVVRRRAASHPADFMAYCAMCRDNLAAAGKRALHLLDLFFPPAEPDPAAHPRIGWSDRQENRSRLKEHLLQTIWQEGPPPMEAHRRIRLAIDPPVRRRLEQRRILLEDVQRVIQHAETSGERLIHPPSGRCTASFRPHQATFWVEYTPAGDGFYTIHNAYAHRMEIVGGQPS